MSSFAPRSGAVPVCVSSQPRWPRVRESAPFSAGATQPEEKRHHVGQTMSDNEASDTQTRTRAPAGLVDARLRKTAHRDLMASGW